MSEKITGYSFITVGLFIILFAAYSVFSVFTANSSPAPLFSFEAVSIPLSALMGDGVGVNTSTEIEIFPKEILNETTNTFAHLFLMGFLASVGLKIATLGTQLVRPIIVKVQGSKIASAIEPKQNG